MNIDQKSFYAGIAVVLLAGAVYVWMNPERPKSFWEKVCDLLPGR